MTKQEKWNQSKVLLSTFASTMLAQGITEDSPLNAEFAKLEKGLEELVAPKKGGTIVPMEEVAKLDENGNCLELQCSISSVFLPATKEYFYTDANSRYKSVTGEGLTRQSRQAAKLRDEAKRVFKASKEAIVADVMAGELSIEDGNAKIAELSETADFSSVGVLPYTEEAEA